MEFYGSGCMPNPKSMLANTTSNKTEGTLSCSTQIDKLLLLRYGMSHQDDNGKLANDGENLTVKYNKPKTTSINSAREYDLSHLENLTIPIDNSDYCVSMPKIW